MIINRIVVFLGKTDRSLLLSSVLLLTFAIVLSGCTREKGSSTETKAESRGITCAIYDRLPSDIAKKVEVNFANKIKLVGITANRQAQDKIEVSYYWQIKDNLGKFTNVYVHFTDSSNNVLFQNDHVFCPKRSFEELKDKFIKETYIIDMPETAKGKEAYIKLGVYVPEPNGPRLKIESSEGAILDEKNTRASVEKIKL
jgi:hypothetical protein